MTMNESMSSMRLAIASEDHSGLDGRVGQHFGRCAAYTLVDVQDGQIGATEVLENPFVSGHAPGDVPSFIAGTKASVMLTGGIGHRAIAFFDQHGIQVSAGHTGTIAEAVGSWIAGTAGGPASCGGHGPGHGEHDHDHGDGHPGCGRTS